MRSRHGRCLILTDSFHARTGGTANALFSLEVPDACPFHHARRGAATAPLLHTPFPPLPSHTLSVLPALRRPGARAFWKKSSSKPSPSAKQESTLSYTLGKAHIISLLVSLVAATAQPICHRMRGGGNLSVQSLCHVWRRRCNTCKEGMTGTSARWLELMHESCLPACLHAQCRGGGRSALEARHQLFGRVGRLRLLVDRPPLPVRLMHQSACVETGTRM